MTNNDIFYIRKHDPTGCRCSNRAGNVADYPVPYRPLKLFCLNPFRGMFIGWNGDVFLCCSDWRFEVVVGNVLQDSVLDIWRNDKFNRIRKKLLNFDRNMPLCRWCNHCGW